MEALANFGEVWFLARGWRRIIIIAGTGILYVALNLGVFVLGDVDPFFLTVNFFLVVLTAATMGFWGGFFAGILSGLIAGPFVLIFVVHSFGTSSVLVWLTRFLAFVLFGIVAGAVSGVFQYQIRTQRDTNDRLVEAQKMEAIGRLTGGVAHDFNNMLTAIGGYSELIQKKTNPKPEIVRLFNGLFEAIRRSASLTHQLLAISRKETMDPRPVNLEETIQSLGKMLQRIIGDNIELQLRLAENSWEIEVDPVHIDQVLMNLAVNSADAMPNGGRLTIRTERLTVDSVFASQHPDVQLGDYMMITVSDTGTGIDKDTLPHIFEPFFTTKEIGKGTGLGLSTTYGIVKQLKGDIWVYSEPRHGTSFKICLPRARTDEHPKASRAHRVRPLPKSVGATILVAEDSVDVRTIVAQFLEDQGYTVIDATDGEQALKIIEDTSKHIDLLITDIMMPKLSGLELIKTVYGLRPSIGVIVTSGYTREEIDNIEITGLADKFIEKPFTGDRLLTLVRELL